MSEWPCNNVWILGYSGPEWGQIGRDGRRGERGGLEEGGGKNVLGEEKRKKRMYISNLDICQIPGLILYRQENESEKEKREKHDKSNSVLKERKGRLFIYSPN